MHFLRCDHFFAEPLFAHQTQRKGGFTLKPGKPQGRIDGIFCHVNPHAFSQFLLDMAQFITGRELKIEHGNERLDLLGKLNRWPHHDQTAPGSLPDRNTVLDFLDNFYGIDKMMEILYKKNRVIVAAQPLDSAQGVGHILDDFLGFAVSDAAQTIPGKRRKPFSFDAGNRS